MLTDPCLCKVVRALFVVTILGFCVPTRALSSPAVAPVPAERPVDKSKSGRDRAPIIHMPLIDTPPRIDADLSDPCWERAHRSEQLWNCSQDRPPAQRAEVWVCADGRQLYVAVHCYDTCPEQIQCQQRKRNGGIWSDDSIEINVDPAYVQARTYSFQITPRGTMNEHIPGGSDAKIEWRGDWRAAGRVVADGWVAEAAIPWETMRYPKGQREIGLSIGRHIPRTDEWTAWPDMGAGGDSREWAHFVGLQLPSVTRPLLVMPNVQTEWTEDAFRTNVGVDLKQTFDNGLTAVATWAPDYRNIEDEVESIDFSYTERYYSDRRPFFTTGGGYLPGGHMLYSRRIEDLDLGLKVFGRIDDTDLGLLQTFTFGEREDTAMRISHRFDDEWSANMEYVRRHVDEEPLNDVWRFNGGQSKTKGCGGQWVGGGYSRSSTWGSPGGYRWDLGIDRWRTAGHWGYWAEYEAVSPDFDTRNGYQPEVDQRGGGVHFNFWDKPDSSWIKSYGLNTWVDRYDHFDGSLLSESYGFAGNLVRKKQRDGLRLSMNWNQRPPHDDSTTSLRYWWGDGLLYKGAHVGYTWGDVASADYESYSAGVSWPLGGSLFGDLYYERRVSDYWDAAAQDEDVDRLTLKVNYDLDNERGWGLCMRSGSAGTNVFATYRQAVRDGIDWFVIFGDPNTDETQPRVAVKLKWVLRK